MPVSAAAPLRILALVPPPTEGLRVSITPLLHALGRIADVRFAAPPSSPPRPGEAVPSVAELRARAFGEESIDWIALSDHDQSISADWKDVTTPRFVWIDDAYVAPVERIAWLTRVAPRLALFTQWRWARFYASAFDGEPLWLPHGVDGAVFHPPVAPAERDIDVLLYGRLDSRVYPFRARLARLVERLHDRRVLVVPHPGYGGAGEPERTLADLLRRSRVALVDGTRHALLLRRYFEVPACGALAAGEIPRDHAESIGDRVYPLNPRMTDAEILHGIGRAVEAAKRRGAELDRHARQILREESNDARAAVLLRALERASETIRRGE